jgi:glutamate-1-semialdehyde 2,1-aminomutase
VRAYRQPGFYQHIEATGERLLGGLRAIFARHRIPVRVQALGARFGMYFGLAPDQVVANYADAQRHDKSQLMRFYAAAIKHGVYFHDYGGAPCHHGFCAAMTAADVDDVFARLDRAAVDESVVSGQ